MPNDSWKHLEKYAGLLNPVSKAISDIFPICLLSNTKARFNLYSLIKFENIWNANLQIIDFCLYDTGLSQLTLAGFKSAITTVSVSNVYAVLSGDPKWLVLLALCFGVDASLVKAAAITSDRVK